MLVIAQQRTFGTGVGTSFAEMLVQLAVLVERGALRRTLQPTIRAGDQLVRRRIAQRRQCVQGSALTGRQAPPVFVLQQRPIKTQLDFHWPSGTAGLCTVTTTANQNLARF